MAYYSSLFLFLFLFLCGVSFTGALNSGFSVELIHRDSPRSPFFNPTETQFQKVSNVVHRSIKRANYLNKAFSSTPENTPRTTITPIEGEYLMSYSIGTPPFKVHAIVDTGSSIVWLQCKPCKDCYNQTSPIFDPLKSSTYKTIPCTSAKCRSSIWSFCDPKQPNCRYFILYGDMSQSNGDFSVETLTLDSTNSSLISFPNIVIGCGHSNTGTFQEETSGIVGLGGGATSLITQLDSSIGGKFSYCLVPMFLESNSSSKLKFGNAAVVSGQGTVSTPLFPGSGDEKFYNVVLEAFSVGDQRIEFGGSSSRTSKQGNVVIDSGSTLTFLPNDVYSRLESAVENLVKLKRVKDPTQELSLCYKTTSKHIEVPIITAHFSGADVELHAFNTFMPSGDGVTCFAFASSEPENGFIFGNLAQQNLLVGYDLHKNIISFKPTDCTKE